LDKSAIFGYSSTVKPSHTKNPAKRMSGGVAIIKIDNPPLNTLSKVVRLKFLRDLESAIKNPVCKIVMIVGCGRAFSVGADIKELESQWISGTEHDSMASYVKAYSTHNVINSTISVK
jgi:enoyl-CoA hydratase/carnithine racemase